MFSVTSVTAPLMVQRPVTMMRLAGEEFSVSVLGMKMVFIIPPSSKEALCLWQKWFGTIKSFPSKSGKLKKHTLEYVRYTFFKIWEMNFWSMRITEYLSKIGFQKISSQKIRFQKICFWKTCFQNIHFWKVGFRKAIV